MRILNAVYSLGAFFSSNGEVPGKLFIDGAESSIGISSCTEDAITILNNDVSSSLKNGHIIVSVNESDDDSVCATCSPIFRKVVSHGDDNVITTTFATFAEVFPEEVYGSDLADEFVEPLFQCEHSRNSHRELPDLEGFCMEQPVFALVAIFLFWLMAPLAFIGLPVGAAMTGLLAMGSPRANCQERRNLQRVGLDEEILSRENGDEASQAEDSSFPSTCTDWKATDQNGSCLYADCNVGLNGAPSDCFSYKEGEVIDRQSIGMTKMDEIFRVDHDLSEADCVQDFCYSSRFDKATCDISIYKAAKSTCVVEQTKNSPVSVAVYPLSTSTLSQNCHLMSLLIFLQAKVFGRDAYVNMQSKQSTYEKDVCAHSSTIQI